MRILFDTFHTDSKEIYRVGILWGEDGESDMIVTPQIPLMTAELPDIIQGTRFGTWEDIFSYEDKFVRSVYHLVDSGFAKMFEFPVIHGSLEEAVSVPNKLALTEDVAVALFGSTDVIGQHLTMLENGVEMEVAAVLENPPENSSLEFEVLVPWHNAPDFFKPDQAGNWYNTFMVGYVQLMPGSTREQVEEKLVPFKNRHFLEERKATSDIILFPLEGEHFRGGDGEKVLSILGIIALAILIISCINYVNLSITQLAQRTKEMGVRKVMGGRPTQLVIQCMSENLIICFTAVLIALIGAFVFIPVVANYFDFGISIESLENINTVLFLLGVGFVVAVLSSGWPSFMLSKETSVDLIHSSLRWNKNGGWLRRGLMVLQFSISIFLVIGTLLIWKQIQFMQNQDLNFNGNLVAATDYYPELFGSPKEIELRTSTIKDELFKSPYIQSVTIANSVPGSYSENYNSFASLDSSSDKEVSLRQLTVDANYFRTFDIPIKFGRDFSEQIESDESAVIINETAMRQYGWTTLEDKYLKAGGDGESRRVDWCRWGLLLPISQV